MNKNIIQARIRSLTRLLHLHLIPMYNDIKAWTLTAWEIEKLAEDTLPPRYTRTIQQLRKNLYTYIASLGAEWPDEDVNTLLLPGTYIEAAKALKALWLSLHLVYMTPAEPPRRLPLPEELYQAYSLYAEILKQIRRYKPVPFKLADELLQAASYLALISGPVEPRHFEELGVARIVADMIWALAGTLS